MDTDEQSNEEVHRAEGLEGSRFQELLTLWSWFALPSWPVGAFTYLKALQTL